jgi:uncharacterized protein involved in type VI secretion and phage assembly
MSTENLLDEQHITNAIVYIDSEEVNYVSLSIDQQFGEHHQFRLVLDYDALKHGFLSNPLEQIALIGKWVHIELQQGNDSGHAYEFKGVIDYTANEGQDGKHGYLIVAGKSPTVLLERGKRLDIFSNMTLQKVFENVTEGIINKSLSLVNRPTYESPVPFLMQYYESDWEFLQRLSAITGETLYYTGYDLVFGMHKDFPDVKLAYDREITNIRFNSRLENNTFINYQYLAEQDEFIEQQSPDKIENANEYVDSAAERSRQTIDAKRPVRTPVSLPVEDTGSLIEMIGHKKVETASQTISVTGISKTCHPRIGRIIKINIPEGLSEASELGAYRVVKVRHEIDRNHRYQCEFEAIPVGLKYHPTPKIQMPVAHSIQAQVTGNDDPQGLGRVQVEFPFARDMRSEIWLRVMVPDAGSSDEVAKNRGFVFIPEKGDQVMIGFEFGDPNRPYVMGSMFHGKNTQGGGDGNNLKTIITKTGHTIEFDDNDGSMGITVKDKNGNEIHLDTKGKNIEITAPETITLNAKNVNINADESIVSHAGETINMTAEKQIECIAGDEFTLLSKNIYTKASEDSAHTAKSYETTAEKIRVDSNKENLELASGKVVDLQSVQKVKLF